MQNTSALYKSIVAGNNHWFETKITIAGTEVAETGIKSLSRSNPGLDSNLPTVGGALSSELSLVIFDTSVAIPRMAEICVYYRACNASQQSEWLQAGVYYVDTRKKNESVGAIGSVSISAYDAMMKFEQDYPSTNHAWPYADMSVITEMASAVGVSVDSRTSGFITAGHMIELPSNYTMREVLGRIAAMYAGNFVISAEGKLLFVPLYGLTDDLVSGYYLADENGNALTFGNEGWYILV